MQQRSSQPEDDKAARTIRLREETEYPFRKIRMFAFAASIASASVGFFISSARLLAKSTGIAGVQETPELLQNIAIDLGVIVACVLLLRNEFVSQAKVLERMAQGARIAALRVRSQQEQGQPIRTLADFRRGRGMDSRIVIFAGSLEMVKQCVVSSNPFSDKLIKNDLTFVPLVIQSDDNKTRCTGEESLLTEAVGKAHIALPLSLDQWEQWVESEAEAASSQGVSSVEKGLTFIIKKNGRVGQRATSCPPWEVLVGSVENRAALGMDTKNI